MTYIHGVNKKPVPIDEDTRELLVHIVTQPHSQNVTIKTNDTIKQSLITLDNATIDTRAKNGKLFHRYRLIQGVPFTNGKKDTITVLLTQPFANDIVKCKNLESALLLAECDSTLNLVLVLEKKPTRDQIKLKNLLRCCPEFPPLHKARNIQKDILNPFLKSLHEATSITETKFKFVDPMGKNIYENDLADCINTAIVMLKNP